MKGYNVEELYYFYRQGCPIAKQYLIRYCYWQIELMLPRYYFYSDLYKFDREDYVQNIIIRCINSLDAYRPDRGMLVKSYLSMIIKNSISSILVKNQYRKVKERALCISLDDTYSDDGNLRYCDIVKDNRLEYQPLQVVDYCEKKEKIENYIVANCSRFEQQVIKGHRLGYKNDEIAKILAIDIKKVYNANYRIQKKMAKFKSN